MALRVAYDPSPMNVLVARLAGTRRGDRFLRKRSLFDRSGYAVLALLLGGAIGAAAGGNVLRIGTSGDYAPFSLRGKGFDVEVAEAMAKDLGLEIEWASFRWPELRHHMLRNDFDVAMSGVTWLPERAVIGASSRAVAQSGPCVVGDPASATVAVNRGGRLERWAREHWPSRAILAIDDNLSLPALLEGGAAGAFVTDSFEVRTRSLPAAAVRCEPPTDRKVYWIAPARATQLAPRIDRWLATHEPKIDELRRRWLGGSAPRDDLDDLVDRIARRLELMPAVAAWKRAHGLPIEDREHEARVLAKARERGEAAGLDADSIERLFAVQIELAKAIESRPVESAPALDLETELRPALSSIGDEIVASLAAVCPVAERSLTDERLALLRPLLQEAERMKLRQAILDVRRSSR